MTAAATIVSPIVSGKFNNRDSSIRCYTMDFTASSVDGSFAVGNLPSNLACLVLDIGIIFDGTTPPNTLTVSIAGGFGSVLYSTSSLVATAPRPILLQAMPVTNGLSCTLSANTTNSAKVKVIFFLTD